MHWETQKKNQYNASISPYSVFLLRSLQLLIFPLSFFFSPFLFFLSAFLAILTFSWLFHLKRKIMQVSFLQHPTTVKAECILSVTLPQRAVMNQNLKVQGLEAVEVSWTSLEDVHPHLHPSCCCYCCHCLSVLCSPFPSSFSLPLLSPSPSTDEAHLPLLSSCAPPAPDDAARLVSSSR